METFKINDCLRWLCRLPPLLHWLVLESWSLINFFGNLSYKANLTSFDVGFYCEMCAYIMCLFPAEQKNDNTPSLCLSYFLQQLWSRFQRAVNCWLKWAQLLDKSKWTWCSWLLPLCWSILKWFWHSDI